MTEYWERPLTTNHAPLPVVHQLGLLKIMTLSTARPASQACENQATQVISNHSISVKSLERQLQRESALETQQVQACQLEPGDRVLYKERLMRVGSIQPSSTRPYGFFVSLLPDEYDNPHAEYKRWQSYHQRQRLEVPSNWFTPWQRVQPEQTPVVLPHDPFANDTPEIATPVAAAEAEGSTAQPIRVVQASPTRFHCKDSETEQGCIVWVEQASFHAPTAVWPELARRAIAAVKDYLKENPLYLEYNRHQCCYCVYRNDEGGRYIGNTSGTTTAEALLQTDQMMQKVRAGVLDKFGI